MGEGGALLINNEAYTESAEIMREKGTNRSNFLRGQVDKYTWIDWGSSYLPSDISAACLEPQLLCADEINKNRLASWSTYYNQLTPLAEQGFFELPVVPKSCEHNAHIFYLKFADIDTRSDFIQHMKTKQICCVFHYVALHSSPAGQKYCRFSGTDEFTTAHSAMLVRLPLYYGMKEEELARVISEVRNFCEQYLQK